MRTAIEIMRDYADVEPGFHGLFTSRDARDTFELMVTDHQATWFFTRDDYNFLRPDIEAAGVSYCVSD